MTSKTTNLMSWLMKKFWKYTKSNPKKSKLKFMQIKRNLYHCIKTLIKNVFLFNFAHELLMSFWIFFYNIAEKNTKLLQWMSDGKFSVFTSSYVNTALNQSAFRIHKCYIIIWIGDTIFVQYFDFYSLT